jgi:hypothetical protein
MHKHTNRVVFYSEEEVSSSFATSTPCVFLKGERNSDYTEKLQSYQFSVYYLLTYFCITVLYCIVLCYVILSCLFSARSFESIRFSLL